MTILVASAMNYAIVISSAVWLGALAYYFIDARKWFTGPKITLDASQLTEAQEQALAAEGLDVTKIHDHGHKGEVHEVGNTGAIHEAEGNSTAIA